MFSILNSWFDLGYQLPLNNESLLYTVNTVKISHDNGYMYIHATPNFENIDLFVLITSGMEKAGYTFTDIANMILGQTNNDTIEDLGDLINP